MPKLRTGVVLGVGYLLGARAGRERYEQIRHAATRVVQRPEIQRRSERLVDAANDKLAAAPAPVQRLASAAGAPWRLKLEGPDA